MKISTLLVSNLCSVQVDLFSSGTTGISQKQPKGTNYYFSTPEEVTIVMEQMKILCKKCNSFRVSVLTALSLSQEPDMMYKTREEQGQLLQQVLAASETDADEERVPGEAGRAGASGPSRRTGSLASMSGADDAVYMEYRRQYLANIKHPLFKKFRG